MIQYYIIYGAIDRVRGCSASAAKEKVLQECHYESETSASVLCIGIFIVSVPPLPSRIGADTRET